MEIGWIDFSKEDRDKVFEEQRRKTGVEYFDYYLLHDMREEHYKIYEDLDCFNWIKKKKELLRKWVPWAVVWIVVIFAGCIQGVIAFVGDLRYSIPSLVAIYCTSMNIMLVLLCESCKEVKDDLGNNPCI